MELFFSPSIPRPGPSQGRIAAHQAHGLRLGGWSPGGRPRPGDAFSTGDGLVVHPSPLLSLAPSCVAILQLCATPPALTPV